MVEFKKKEHHITSLKHFVDVVGSRHYSTTVNPHRWIFRGHDNYDYKLLPSIGRLLNTGRFTDVQKILKAEKNAFQQFEIDTYHELKEANLFILLAVAQHHGLKTRLLDWSFSPLVALFFAVENEKMFDVDGAFFAYNTQKAFTNTLRKKEHPFEITTAEYQYLSTPSLTPRINAQSGVFQLFREPTKPLENAAYLEKFFIPAKSKQDLKIELYSMGITYHSLFPDTDGITRNINYMQFF